MFYSDYGVTVYATRLHRYIERSHAHYYSEYVNLRFIRHVLYDDVVWC